MAQLEKSLSNFLNLQPFSPPSLIVKDNRDKFHDCDFSETVFRLCLFLRFR